MKKIIETKTNYQKKVGTKTVWEIDRETKREITEEEHDLTTKEETVKAFRRAGSREILTYGYTSWGYKVVKLVSISPCKESKTIREYKFIWKV